MLTVKQAAVLAMIDAYQRAHGGAAPAYEDIRHALGFKSKSSVNRLLVGLEARGAIRRLPGRARAIEVIRRGNGAVLVAPAADRLRIATATLESMLVDDDRYETLSCGTCIGGGDLELANDGLRVACPVCLKRDFSRRARAALTKIQGLRA